MIVDRGVDSYLWPLYLFLTSGSCVDNHRVWCPWLVPTMSRGAKVWMVLPLAQLHTTNKVPVSPNGECVPISSLWQQHQNSVLIFISYET